MTSLFSFRKRSGRTRRRVAPLVHALLQHQKNGGAEGGAENGGGGGPGSRNSRRRISSPARLGLAIGTAILLSLILCVQFWPSRVTLKIGDIATQTIVAQRTVRYEDTSATQLLRAEASRVVERRYEQIPDATMRARDAVLNVFSAIEEAAFLRPPSSVSPSPANRPATLPLAADTIENRTSDDKSARSTLSLALLQIRRRADLSVSETTVRTMLLADAATRREAALRAVTLAEQGMRRAIRDEGMEIAGERETTRRAALSSTGKTVLSPALLRAVGEIAGQSLRPNLRFDARQTDRDSSLAQQRIPQQMRRLAAGTPVLQVGERVTQQHVDAFAALGLQNPNVDAPMIAGVVFIVTLLVALVVSYIRSFHRELYRDTSSLLLLSLLSVFSVLGLKIGMILLGVPQGGAHHLAYLGMMCVASAGMIAALLVSPAVATLLVSLLSVIAGLLVNSEPRFLMITLGSSLVGIVATSTLRNRNDLVRAVLLVCGANAILNALVGAFEGDTTAELLPAVFWGLTSGLFALMLFWIGVAVFERMFGITTHLRLLELSDPATPILQEFRLRVPGTYAHSLMVGNLAHAAAEAIGADALLCRVAAYYHDLGKMNRPQFFIENQHNADNIHDRLNPSLSALILTAHVKDGVAIAETLGLPRRVREVIAQHHGTTLMRFFYQRAVNAAEQQNNGNALPARDAKLLESQFRYPGPKPQTREAAILMLADTVEAASRTLERPTPARIQEFVARLIEEKQDDDQLDECDLTMRDLKTVEELFARTLSGVLHGRIEYPKKAAAGAADASANGAAANRNGTGEARPSSLLGRPEKPDEATCGEDAMLPLLADAALVAAEMDELLMGDGRQQQQLQTKTQRMTSNERQNGNNAMSLPGTMRPDQDDAPALTLNDRGVIVPTIAPLLPPPPGPVLTAAAIVAADRFGELTTYADRSERDVRPSDARVGVQIRRRIGRVSRRRRMV